MDYITVKGYKSFKDLSLKLNKINLLIGSNGSGKSNFLSLFELLGNAYEQRLGFYVAQMGGVDKVLHQGRKVTDTISINVGQKNNNYVLTLMESDGRLIVEQESLGYHQSFEDITTFGNETSLKYYDGLRRGDYIKEYISQIKKFHFHDTGRTSPFTSESHIVNDSYQLYAHGENIASLLYRILQAKPLVYKRIRSIIQSIAPYFNDFYFNISEAGTVRLQWQDKYSEMIYGPSDLSDGTIRFIALTVLFMQPWLPKVIIIDEPELGLHPVAIDKLAGLINIAAQQGTQVIIATQSAELISKFQPEDVLTVNQIHGATEIKRLSSAELKNWLDDYTLGDLWKQNIMKGGQPV